MTCQGKENVIEIRCVHGELLDVDRMLIEPIQQSPQRFHPTIAEDPQGQVFFPRQQIVHRRELTGDPDYRAHCPGLGRNVMPGDPYRPTVGLHQRGQHVHRRRLTRPIRAEQGKNRARTNI